MASFMNKALQYLGLKDIDDEGFYDDEEEAEHVSGHGRASYADSGEENAASGATVRALMTEDPRDAGGHGVVRPLLAHRQMKPQVVTPMRFADAQEIGDLVKGNHPVIVNLQASERDLARRMIDFCSGLSYALSGGMEKVAEQVFLLTPSNVEVSAEERQKLQERGLIRT